MKGVKKRRESVPSRALRGVESVDRFTQRTARETAAGLGKGAEALTSGAQGIQIKEPSKIRQLIGGASTGAGVYEAVRSGVSLPFAAKVETIAGRSGTEPFAMKVAAVTGRSGLEPSESFSLKVASYVGGAKRREEVLEQERGLFEKLKAQVQAKQELQELISAQQPAPSIQQPIPSMQQPITTPGIQQPTPTMQQPLAPAQQGKKWSEKSKRWVKYTREPYDKNLGILPQQTY